MPGGQENRRRDSHRALMGDQGLIVAAGPGRFPLGIALPTVVGVLMQVDDRFRGRRGIGGKAQGGGRGRDCGRDEEIAARNRTWFGHGGWDGGLTVLTAVPPG